MQDVMAIVLAGGKGTRLEPLTRDRAKPAVPFGGIYRIIDFTLSNCVNSGLRRITLLTQYKARSLDQHIRRGWNFLNAEMGEMIETLPPQQRIDDHWYQGTADAIYQNIYSIEREHSTETLILAGDHIYKMDYAEMLKQHRQTGADLTVACLPIPVADCRHFGIMQTASDNRITRFEEKPKEASGLVADPAHCLASMGVYVFSTAVLCDRVLEDANDRDSEHDFGKNIIPKMIDRCRVYAYPFQDRNRKAVPYWRDVGTIDAYFQAHMDLVQVDPVLNLYDQTWPIWTHFPGYPPPKFVFDNPGEVGTARRGEAHDSLISPGCIISGGHVKRSILSPNVRINSYASVEDSILMEGVEIGRNCRIRHAIIDKGVKIPPGTFIGYDRAEDQQNRLTISEGGISVVAKGTPEEQFRLG